MEKDGPIRSVQRAITILQIVNRGKSLSLIEIANASEIPYPTTCRILLTLVHEGLVEREPGRKRYRPTPLVQTLSHGFQGHGRLIEAAAPHMADLTRIVGWPVSLTTHVGAKMVIRHSTHAMTSMTFNTYHPGYSIPILECAAGQTYLAHAPVFERESLLNSLELMQREGTAYPLQLLREEETVAALRQKGYATRRNNAFTENPGMTSSIAVPLLSDEGLEGALTLVFFSKAYGMKDAVEQFEAPLKACARAIAEELNRVPSNMPRVEPVVQSARARAYA